jgi:hypothetical protein
LATNHTSWQGRAAQSNSKEQARVAKKYKGVKKISEGAFSDSDMEADPFMENDPVLDTMDPGRRHDPKQYAKAASLPLKRAKQVLKESEQ